MEGMYAGFAGAKTGHGGPAFDRRWGIRRIRRTGLLALAAFGRRHLRTMRTVGGKHAVKSSQINPRLRHQRDESRNEVQRLEDDMCGAIAVRGLEFVAHMAIAQP